MESVNKKILFVAPYFPPHSGGLERYVYEVATRIKKNFKSEVVVLTTGEKGNVDYVEEVNGVKIYRLGYSLKISNTPFSLNWYSKIKKILKDESPDLINIHMPVPGIGDLVSFLAKDVPILLTYHAGSMKKGKFIADILVAVYEKIFLQVVFRRANYITCSSDFVRDGIASKFIDKSETITPAVDSGTFGISTKKKENKFTVMFAAGLGYSDQHKGLEQLLSAIQEVKIQNFEVQLFVVGDGDMRKEYESMAEELGIKENVIFWGKLHGQDLVDKYQRAHVFCLPTKNDSFSMVILEAMATGLPVVSFNTGSIPSLVRDGETGFLLDKKSSAREISEKIIFFIKDINTASLMGLNGSQLVQHDYTWQKQVQRYSDLCNKLLKQQKLIVHVSPYYPPHLGGLELVAQNLAEGLANRGRKVLVLASLQNIWGNVEKKENIEIRRLGSLEVAHTPIAFSLFYNLLKIPKNSLIHFHLAQVYWIDLTYLVARIKKIPYIIHFHGDVVPSGPLGKLYVLHKKYIQSKVLQNASQVIVLSNEQIGFIEKTYGVSREKIVYVPNGTNPIYFRPRVRKEVVDKLKLIYAGRLSFQKRLDRLVEVMEKIDVPSELVFVGEGEERGMVEGLIRQKGLNNITLVGRKEPDQLVNYLLDSDIFLLSSVFEGMPLVVMEAMATGLPIIATNVQGTRELVDGVGILVDEPYTENFVKSVKEVYGNKELLRKLSENSIAKSKMYTWSNSVDMVEQLYKEINHEKF